MGAWPGLSHGVVQVGLDPVVIAAQRRCVVSAALSRRGGLTGYVVPVGHAVVDVALPADPGGVWERVGGRGQVDALAKPTWVFVGVAADPRSEEHTSELQSLMRISYAVFCLKKKKIHIQR